MPRIENWSLIGGKLFGEVYGDERFPDGHEIVTSTVQKFREREGFAQTLNTRYKLGKKNELAK